MYFGFHDLALPSGILLKKGRVGYREAGFAASPQSYPQKLWIRLWMNFE
jgi:hypothetical protein